MPYKKGTCQWVGELDNFGEEEEENYNTKKCEKEEGKKIYTHKYFDGDCYIETTYEIDLNAPYQWGWY
jgi:hypothetical protein